MHIKLYLEVNDLEQAYAFYKKIFLAEDIKVPTAEGKHASLKMFGKITLLLHRSLGHKPSHQAYYVVRFEDNEVDDYLRAIESAKINLEDKDNLWVCKARWGTTFWEFKDPFGFSWDFEINTSALKD